MRALIVTNMYPSPRHPELGSFVRDQVAALQRIAGVELELFTFDPGGPQSYAAAARQLRRRYRHDRFDIVHAHFGLTAWPALAVKARARALTMHGTDLAHPRSRAVTLAALRFIDLPAAVSHPLAHTIPRWATTRQVAVLPCGVDLERFHPVSRTEARTRLGLDHGTPYVLFPADPARPEKRYDRALAVAGDTRVLTLGHIDPEQVPLWVNAANAVLVPSEREGFGLAVLEALACDVPVLATPTGIAPEVLSNAHGTYCGPYDHDTWQRALQPHLTAADPRIEGRAHAQPYSTDAMAARVLEAWRTVTATPQIN
jgi:glycosyltransferase involved in cell wall biosynthesis